MSDAEGAQFAAEIGAPFFATSARTRTNVQESIFELCRCVERTSLEIKLVVVGSGGVGKVFFFLSDFRTSLLSLQVFNEFCFNKKNKNRVLL